MKKMLSDLLLDVRFHIASFDEEVWYLFYKNFDDFKLLTCQSIPLFKSLFTKKCPFDNRVEYRLLGRLHRNDGPAVIYTHGTQKWYQHGKIHRDDGPAVIFINGDQVWYQYGKFHRDNKPAVIYADGKQWYQHGKCHRDDGPAVIYSNGNQYWYQHGKPIN